MMSLRKMEKRSLEEIALKAILFAIFVLALFFVTSAKEITIEKIDTYSMSSINQNVDVGFDISVGDDKTLWIDVYSTYKPGEKVGFNLEADLLPDFVNTFEIAKDQYIQWKQVAIENNMQEVRQKMDLIFYTQGYFQFLNELKTDNEVKVIFAFTYFKGDYVLIMNLDKMTATDNERIEFNGASIVFNSEKEIDSFLSKISLKSLNNLQANSTGSDSFK